MNKTALFKSMSVKFSSPSKMPCYSWSLQALDTCPASIGPDGQLVDACKGCYATTGNYLYPNVKSPREHNKQDWQRAGWAADMIAFISTQSHFRWFDSGDLYHIKLAKKILEVMKATPQCKHWLPTRMYKFSKFTAVLDQMNALENVVVRFSSDSIKGAIIRGQFTSTIIPHADDKTIATVCGAYANEGKCGDCRACWSRDVQIIAYPQHGLKMARLNLKTI